jgi:hypothetical protein
MPALAAPAPRQASELQAPTYLALAARPACSAIIYPDLDLARAHEPSPLQVDLTRESGELLHVITKLHNCSPSAFSSWRTNALSEVTDGFRADSSLLNESLTNFTGRYTVTGTHIFSSSRAMWSGNAAPGLNCILRFDASNDFYFFWLNLSSTISDCLPTVRDLMVGGLRCNGTAVTAPFARIYSCSGGVDLQYLANYNGYVQAHHK